MDLSTLKKQLNKSDAFAQFNGISVDVIEDGFSCVILNIGTTSYDEDYISNALITAVSEKAAYCAARSACKSCYCATSNFNIVNRTKNASLLKATAKRLHHGKSTAVYETVVVDNKDNLIAKGTYTIIITA